MASTQGTVERRTLRLSWGAAFAVVGTVVGMAVARHVFVAAHRPLSWAAAAAVAAVLLDPLVDVLGARIRRLPAVLVVFATLAVTGVGLAYRVVDEIDTALDRLETAAPSAAGRVEQRDDRLGELAVDLRLQDRVVDLVDAVQERAAGGEDVLRSTAGTAPTYLVAAILTIFLMTYGPRMAHSAVNQVTDPARRRRLADVGQAAITRGRRSILLQLAVAAVYGVAVSITATTLDLPAPAALGLTAAVMGLLPYVGIAAGSLPLLLLVTGYRAGTTALLLAAVVLALQVVDVLLLRPWIAHHSIATSLLVPWVVALLGYTIYGIGGAVYGVAIAIFVLGAVERHHELDVDAAEAVR